MTTFIRSVGSTQKAEALVAGDRSRSEPNRFEVDMSRFSALPGSPFAYWGTDRIRKLFEVIPALGAGRTARPGLATADDFRFVRTCWESPPGCKGCHPFAKGGSHSPYYG